MFWLWWWPVIRFPLSGGVTQDIEPHVDWFFGSITPETGDREIEQRVFTEVASYGRQIGQLVDLVTALPEAKALGNDQTSEAREAREAYAKLVTFRERTRAVKDETRTRYAERARAALDQLERHDPSAYQKLLAERAPKPTA